MRKLSMYSAHRWAMLRNMVTSLIHHERIMTTTPKAKELRRVADQCVGYAKEGNIIHY
jgi:large subunit ribosomal protein L17